MEIAAIIISIIALVVSFWQGYLAKQQVDIAKETNKDTGKLLDEIKERTKDIESISKETKKHVEDSVNKIIETFLKNIDPSEQSKNKVNEEVTSVLLQAFIQNPDSINKLMEFADKQKKNEE